MQRIENSPFYPPSVGKLRPEQIANQATWEHVPDDEQKAAAMTAIRTVNKNGSTETTVNPLDPGDQSTNEWNVPPVGWDKVSRTGTWRS